MDRALSAPYPPGARTPAAPRRRAGGAEHAACCRLVPDVLHDDDNPQQQWASSAVKDRLVEMACSEDYTDFLRQFSEANQASAVPTMVEASETSLPQPPIKPTAPSAAKDGTGAQATRRPST